MKALYLKDITSIDLLAGALSIDQKYLEESAYSTYFKPAIGRLLLLKRNKKRRKKEYRTIRPATQKWLQDLLKEISFIINRSTPTPPDYVQGFIENRSTKTNARIHLNQNIILKLDIQNFFDSITSVQVAEVLVQFGCDESAAKVISNIVTVSGTLPQGFSCSPIISNLVAARFDPLLEKLAQKYNAKYSRYSDDITFSSNNEVPSAKEIQSILKPFNFSLHPDKTIEQKRGMSQYVTGLSISNQKKPRLPRNFKKKLRLTSYFIHKHGFTTHAFKSGYHDESAMLRYAIKLRGRYAYAKSIEEDLECGVIKIISNSIADLEIEILKSLNDMA